MDLPVHHQVLVDQGLPLHPVKNEFSVQVVSTILYTKFLYKNISLNTWANCYVLPFVFPLPTH